MDSYDYTFLSSPTLSTYQNVAPVTQANMMSTGYQSPYAQMVNSYTYGSTVPYQGANSKTGDMVRNYLLNSVSKMAQPSNSYSGGNSNGAEGLISPSGAYQVSGQHGGLWNLLGMMGSGGGGSSGGSSGGGSTKL